MNNKKGDAIFVQDALSDVNSLWSSYTIENQLEFLLQALVHSKLYHFSKSADTLTNKYYYALFANGLLYCINQEKKSPKAKVLKAMNLIIAPLPNLSYKEETIFGFQLRVMNNHLDFYVKDEALFHKWVQSLTVRCVQVDIMKDYHFVDVLGSGDGFKYCLAERRASSDVRRRVKVYLKKDLSAAERAALKEQVSILRSVSHEALATFHGIYENEKNVYLLMEQMPGETLLQYILRNGRVAEDKAAQLVQRLAEAMMHLHENKVLLRDVKLENLVLEVPNQIETAKIADFSLAVRIGKKTPFFKAGTPGYVAPEVFTAESYDLRSDYFSLGCVLYCLLSGRPPFFGDNQDEILQANAECQFTFPTDAWRGVSISGVNLVKGLMHHDPEHRLSGEEVLRHNWTNGARDKKYEGNYTVLSSRGEVEREIEEEEEKLGTANRRLPTLTQLQIQGLHIPKNPDLDEVRNPRKHSEGNRPSSLAQLEHVAFYHGEGGSKVLQEETKEDKGKDKRPSESPSMDNLMAPTPNTGPNDVSLPFIEEWDSGESLNMRLESLNSISATIKFMPLKSSPSVQGLSH